ncbi:hypothetical protein MBLNU459_g4942t2 [Dothideomycetes sp. NU459]
MFQLQKEERGRVSSPLQIERLESYIRGLGGDPEVAKQIIASGEDDARDSSSGSHSTKTGALGNPASTSRTDISPFPVTKAGLVEHDKQVTYIEAPMWYSWSSAKESEGETQGSSQEQVNLVEQKSKKMHCFPTLLDPIDTLDIDSLRELHPLATDGIVLWKQYLKNVHPLINIFFDWEIELIVQKAFYDPTKLTSGERALVFAIYFIATLSLTEEQCIDLVNDHKSQLLGKFQNAVEESLLIAEFIVTSDRLVLQSLMLYLLVMRNRAHPAAIHSLTGVASRIAERMGLHHDGDALGIPVLRSEERRRIWWQLQHMEIDMGQLIGTFSMMIYADWDTKMPSNLEDRDLHPNVQVLPPARRGLTNISHCLWRYQILNMQRDTMENGGEQFLQHCEPLNPLHVHTQIGIRSFVLAARRMARQPALANVKLSDMSPREREDFLAICTKGFEYYVLSKTTDSLRGFQWHMENYFPWAAFVYIILEAHHRFGSDTVADLWSLIGKVYVCHPPLMAATSRPDIASIARMTLVAWQRRQARVPQHNQQRYNTDLLNESEPPPWIQELSRKIAPVDADPKPAPDAPAREPMAAAAAAPATASHPLPLEIDFDFDFDMIDWSFWDKSCMDAALYDAP